MSHVPLSVAGTEFYGANTGTGSLHALWPAAPMAATRNQYFVPLTMEFNDACFLVLLPVTPQLRNDAVGIGVARDEEAFWSEGARTLYRFKVAHGLGFDDCWSYGS